MALKRFICSCGIILIISMSFLTGYIKSVDFVYADSTTDQWTQVTTNEQLVEAFRYYCKSRNMTIDGSVSDLVTKFTTRTFNGICNFLGYDITALQAHLKYQTDGNLGLRFLFDQTGISAYNAIFSQFLQDNNLSVGDTNVDKNIYSGEYYVDDDGNKCLVYVINQTGDFVSGNDAVFQYMGTPYKYSPIDLYNLSANGNTTFSGSFNNGTRVFTFPVNKVDMGNGTYITSRGTSYGAWYNFYYLTPSLWQQYGNVQGNVGIRKTNGLYSIGYFTERIGNYDYKYTWQLISMLDTDDFYSMNINIVSNVINNNVYEGDTIINNNGTTGDDDNPSGGGDQPGGGGDQPGGGGNTTTPPTNTGGGSGEDDGTITFPDFDFHLPEINWSLGDLSEKFPFSIPFDLIAFFTVLNAEPQAPAIDADIPLGSWYTWHFEADFAQFDNYAVIIRNVEFIGFCVGLIYLTIKLVKG